MDLCFDIFVDTSKTIIDRTYTIRPELLYLYDMVLRHWFYLKILLV